MQWRHAVDGRVSAKQNKTGERLAVPIHERLASVLEDAPRDHLFIVHRRDGRPYTRQADQARLAESAIVKLESRTKVSKSGFFLDRFLS